MKRLIIATAYVALAFPSSALAAEPLPISAISPASGATYEPGAGGIGFELTSVPNLSNVRLEISTQPIAGQDGTLADDFQQDTILLFKSDAYPTVYRGQSSAPWSQTPGTYYWQIDAVYLPGDGSGIRRYLGPVYTITIAPPQTPTLTVGEAKIGVKEIIQARTHHAAHYIRDNCRQRTQNQVTCSATWTGSTRISPSTWLYSGAFVLEVRLPERHLFAFVGVRAQYGCVKQHGAKRCSHSLKWVGG